MTTERRHVNDAGWEQIGRAAEHFARRIARDASRFAERLEEHTSEFAREMSHEWRRTRRAYRHSCGRSETDVRRVFEDVRMVLADVIDGVDELIERVFREPKATSREQEAAQPPDTGWTSMVSNRAVPCSACGRVVEAGEDGFFARTAEGVTVRCAACGAPASETS